MPLLKFAFPQTVENRSNAIELLGFRLVFVIQTVLQDRRGFIETLLLFRRNWNRLIGTGKLRLQAIADLPN